MDEKRIPKNILYGRFYSTRIRSRPGNQWEDAIRKDSEQLLRVLFGGGKQVEGREEWRRRLKKARHKKN